MNFDDIDAMFADFSSSETVKEEHIEDTLEAHGNIITKHRGTSGKYRILTALHHGYKGKFSHAVANNEAAFVQFSEYQVQQANVLCSLHALFKNKNHAFSLEGFDPNTLNASRLQVEASQDYEKMRLDLQLDTRKKLSNFFKKYNFEFRENFTANVGCWWYFYSHMHTQNALQHVVAGRPNITQEQPADVVQMQLMQRSKQSNAMSPKEFETFIEQSIEMYRQDFRKRHRYMHAQLLHTPLGVISLGSAHFASIHGGNQLPSIEEEFNDDTYWVFALKNEEEIAKSMPKNPLHPTRATIDVINKTLEQYRNTEY